MTEQLLILAEGASQHAEGVPPYLIGLGTFAIALSLLGITYLSAGFRKSEPSAKAKRSTER